MLVTTTYEQTDQFDPMDPQQIRQPFYGYPVGSEPMVGGWNHTLYNRVADAGSLKGLGRGLGAWATLPSWVQIGIVGLSSAAVGYFAMSKFGDSHIKPALRRIGIGR